jgi:hypothetical protein
MSSKTKKARMEFLPRYFRKDLGFGVYDLLDTGERYFACPYPEIALDQLNDGFPGLSDRLMQDPYSALGETGKIRIYDFQA